MLRLQQFGVAELAGDVSYRGAGAYDFDVHSQRSSPSITGRFLPASEDAGVGASLSLSLQGQLAPDWRIAVRADDIASALKWSNLATDSSELNSQVTSRDADGSLVYGPLLKGKKALLPVSSQIGVHWQAEVGWAMLASQGQSRELTLRVSRQANISQSWFGFDSRYQSRATPHWRLEFEPVWRTAQLALAWGGWQVIMGTDGRGVESRYRQLKIGWESEL